MDKLIVTYAIVLLSGLPRCMATGEGTLVSFFSNYDDLIDFRIFNVTCNADQKVFAVNKIFQQIYIGNNSTNEENYGNVNCYAKCKSNYSESSSKDEISCENSTVAKHGDSDVELATLHITYSCAQQFLVTVSCHQKEGRIQNGGPPNQEDSHNNKVQIVIFAVSGTGLIALMGFAIIRVRRMSNKLPDNERRASSISRQIHGIENGSLAVPESRAQEILNTINAGGGNYSVVEVPESVPGRRVFLLSPGTEWRPGLSRIRSQLSDISEEALEEEEMSVRSDSTSSECGNAKEIRMNNKCDVNNKNKLPLSDITNVEDDRKVEDGGLFPGLKMVSAVENSNVQSEYDFRTSLKRESYLEEFGWTPRTRITSDESVVSSSTSGDLFSSIHSSISSINKDCDFYDHKFDERLKISDKSVSTTAINVDTAMTESTLSLPATLNVSGIPDIKKVLSESSTLISKSFDDSLGEL